MRSCECRGKAQPHRQAGGTSGRAEVRLDLFLLLAGKAFSLLTDLLVTASSSSPVLAQSGRSNKELYPGSFGFVLGEEKELDECSAVLYWVERTTSQLLCLPLFEVFHHT